MSYHGRSLPCSFHLGRFFLFRRLKRRAIDIAHDRAAQLANGDAWHQLDSVGIVFLHLLPLHDRLEDCIRVRGSKVCHALALAVVREPVECDPVHGRFELASGPETERVAQIDEDAVLDVRRLDPLLAVRRHDLEPRGALEQERDGSGVGVRRHAGAHVFEV